LNETPLTYFEVGGRKFEIGGTDNVGITRSLDMALKSLDEKARKCEEAITAWEKNIASAEEELNRPWDHEEKFKALEVELQTLEAELRQDAPKQDDTLRQAQDNAPVIERKSISLAGQGITDVCGALDAIKAMMSDPATLARFADEDQPIPVTTESLVELGEKIEQMQALYELGAVMQLSLFGDQAAVASTPRKRRR
jgi:chromosome segregation ATPase